MPCEQFVRDRPRDHWVRLTGCELDYDSPGYREADGHIAEIFFPIRTAGQRKGTPAPLLAATTDPDALAIVQATIGNGRPDDQEAITVMMLRVVTYLRVSREVEGVARAAFVETLRTRQSLRSFPVALKPNYVVIDLHARPKYVVPGVETGVGLLSVLLFLLGGRRRRAEVIQEAPGAIADARPLLAMLLLNLHSSAGVEAIEHAPPLGSREETIAAFASALNGLTFDDRGSARVARPDYTLSINIGVHEPVWTATVLASGAGAAGAITALAGTMGWRVYVPKRGAFMD
jgi:hypothetical protein